MTKKITSFDKAYQELNEIAMELEAQKLPIEQLAEKVERAAALSAFCKKRLREIEEKLEELDSEKEE